MAQDFENEFASSISNSSGSPTTIVTANSDDALISIRCVNKASATATVSVTITDSVATAYFVIKDAPVPVGGSLELIDSGSKIVMQNGDILKAYSDTESAINVLVSRVDAIST
jgi:hypothetical protein